MNFINTLIKVRYISLDLIQKEHKYTPLPNTPSDGLIFGYIIFNQSKTQIVDSASFGGLGPKLIKEIIYIYKKELYLQNSAQQHCCLRETHNFLLNDAMLLPMIVYKL